MVVLIGFVIKDNMLRRGRFVVLSALVRTGVNNTSTDARGLVCGGVDKNAVCLDMKFEIRSFKLQASSYR